MAEPAEIAKLALLCDVRDLKVTEDGDGTVWLALDNGEQANVCSAMWALERAGEVYQPDDCDGFRLTQRGLDVLEGRR